MNASLKIYLTVILTFLVSLSLTSSSIGNSAHPTIENPERVSTGNNNLNDFGIASQLASQNLVSFLTVANILERGGIPTENLQPYNVIQNSTSPLSGGVYQWHTFYGSNNSDVGYGITVDSDGGVLITGISDNSWNGPSGEAPLHAHSGYRDITVLRFDSAGLYQWHTFYGSIGVDLGSGIVMDGNGGIYITGSSEGSWNGPSGQPPLHPFSGAWDITVLKLNISGGYQWHTFYGSTSGDGGNGVTVDSSSGVYITGDSGGSWNGPLGQQPLHAFSDTWDISVLKLDTAGDYQWHTFYGSESSDIGHGITVHSDSGVYITGESYSSWNGPTGQPPLQAFSELRDITVLKLNTAGGYQWHTFYGSESDDIGFGITVDSNSGIYIAGESGGSWNGPSGQPPLHAFSSTKDITVLKLDTAGGYQWHTFYGSEGIDSGIGIVVGGIFGVYITGESHYSWNGPTGQVPLHTHSGYWDIVILKLDTKGVYQWHTFYGAIDDIDNGYEVTVDKIGGVYITGNSSGSWSGPADQPPLHAHSGANDVVALELQGGGIYSILDLPIDDSECQNGLNCIWSFFDHEYPIYRAEPNIAASRIMKYTGERPNGIVEECEAGRSCYSGHDGYDFSFNVDPGDPVLAAVVGEVSSDFDSCLGNWVKINHGSYQTLYAHLKNDSYWKRSGHVESGERIGSVGNSGSCSTGYHLHFSVFYDQNNDGVFESPDELVDPYGWRNMCSQVITDPWTLTFKDRYNREHTGATSYWLWKFSPPACSYYFAGSEQTLNTDDGVSVYFPAGAINNTATVAYNIAPDPSGMGKLAIISDNDTLNQTTIATGHTFQITAIYTDGMPVWMFTMPVTTTLTYTDSDIIYSDESTLGLYRWEEIDANWILLPTTLDTILNQVIADIDQPGIFSLRGQPVNPAPTMVSVSPTTGSNLEDLTIIVTGTNFLSTPTLNLNVGSLNVQFITSIKLIATIPAKMAPGTYDLLLRNPDGQTALLPNAVTILNSTFLPLCIR